MSIALLPQRLAMTFVLLFMSSPDFTDDGSFPSFDKHKELQPCRGRYNR